MARTNLSINECREILNNPNLTDEEVAAYRDEMYALANRFLDGYFAQLKNQKTSTIEEL